MTEAANPDNYRQHMDRKEELKRTIDIINRLEAALRGVIAIADRDCPEFREARAALEGKQDGQ